MDQQAITKMQFFGSVQSFGGARGSRVVDPATKGVGHQETHGAHVPPGGCVVVGWVIHQGYADLFGIEIGLPIDPFGLFAAHPGFELVPSRTDGTAAILFGERGPRRMPMTES